MNETTDQQLEGLEEYAEASLTWKGPGFCKARHQKEVGDFCNRKVVPFGDFCEKDMCVIHGCKRQAVVWYPLLTGEPQFCSRHHKPKYTKKYGVDQSGDDKWPEYPFE